MALVTCQRRFASRIGAHFQSCLNATTALKESQGFGFERSPLGIEEHGCTARRPLSNFGLCPQEFSTSHVKSPKPGAQAGAELGLLRARQFKRKYFLKSGVEHASLQYLDKENEGIAVISLNRYDTRNAIGAEMLKQLHSILEGLRYGSHARVLIVTSSIPGVFCAGADLKERQTMGFLETERFVSSLRSTFMSLEGLQMPTIAAIEGAALGGGLELALACDIRVCGEGASFGLPETSLAIIPGAGGTQRLPRVIGRSRAKELIFTAERVDAKRAESLGLVDHCVMEDTAFDKALSIAQKVLAQGPLAVKVAKHAIDHGVEMDPTKGMLFEEACYARLLRSTDRLEGLAAFAQKRKPVYKGE